MALFPGLPPASLFIILLWVWVWVWVRVCINIFLVLLFIYFQVGKDKNLDYDPCCLNYFSTGDFLVVGGSDRKVRTNCMFSSFSSCRSCFLSYCYLHFAFYISLKYTFWKSPAPNRRRCTLGKACACTPSVIKTVGYGPALFGKYHAHRFLFVILYFTFAAAFIFPLFSSLHLYESIPKPNPKPKSPVRDTSGALCIGCVIVFMPLNLSTLYSLWFPWVLLLLHPLHTPAGPEQTTLPLGAKMERLLSTNLFLAPCTAFTKIGA